MASRGKVSAAKPAEKAAPAKAAEPAKAPEPAKTEEKTESKPRTVNVMSLFRPNQVQEFKEAFTMIDQNRDGVIDIEDLKDMYSNLGGIPPESDLKAMLKEAPGTLNFTAFLQLFGEKMGGTDPESTILDAFAMFDDESKGWLPEDYLKDLLSNMGDNFKPDEIKQTWKEAQIEKGRFDYKAFTALIKGKAQED